MRFGEAESRVAPVWSMRDTSVAAVADHLARLWTMAGDDGPRVTEKGMPHARASVLNLIVTVPDEPSAGRVVETMMGLGFRHPSRAIVLVANPDGDRARPSTRRSARTATPGHQARGAGLLRGGRAHRPRRGGLAPGRDRGAAADPRPADAVWWPGDPPFADPVFDQLVELGDRLIIDSNDFSDLLRRATGGWPTCAAAAAWATWPGSGSAGGRS